jgi:hypothetical protein
LLGDLPPSVVTVAPSSSSGGIDLLTDDVADSAASGAPPAGHTEVALHP